MVVLNTCCIRESADQRLYGTLGRLKELVDAKPGLQIAVGGCLAQKDRERIPGDGGLGRRRLRHPQPDQCTCAPATGRDRGPGHGDPRRSGARVGDQSAPRARRRPCAALRGVGQHPDGMRQLLRLLHRPVHARPGGEPSPRRHRGRGGAARPQRGQRGDAARAERELLRPRHHEATAAVRRAAPCRGGRWEGIGRVPLHQSAPQGPATRDDRSQWRRRPRSQNSCTCRSSPGERPRLRSMRRGTRRRATSNGWPPRLRPSTIWR